MIHGISDLCTIVSCSFSVWSSPSSWCYRSYKNGMRLFTTPSVAGQRRREASLGHHLCCFSFQVGFLLLCITGWLHPFFFVSELNWSSSHFLSKKWRNSHCRFFSFFPQKKKRTVDFVFHVILRVECWKWVAEWDNKSNGDKKIVSTLPPPPPDPSVLLP